jgi:hypothetical protein
VPLGLPNVVTTPMLRVDTIVVDPRINTKIARPPGHDGDPHRPGPAGFTPRRGPHQQGDHRDDQEQHRCKHLPRHCGHPSVEVRRIV